MVGGQLVLFYSVLAVVYGMLLVFGLVPFHQHNVPDILPLGLQWRQDLALLCWCLFPHFLHHIHSLCYGLHFK